MTAWPGVPGQCGVCGRQLDDAGTCRCVAAPPAPGPVHEVQAGAVVWAQARGYWRPARVIAVGRRRVRVAFVVRGPRLVEQALPAEKLRHERPRLLYGVVDTPPPAWPRPAEEEA